jgi:hypothetical protein
MIAINQDTGWHFALVVELERVFAWHVQLAPTAGDINDVYADTVHLLKALDPAARAVVSLGVYDRRALADVLATLPNRAHLRGNPLEDIAAAQLSLSLTPR